MVASGLIFLVLLWLLEGSIRKIWYQITQRKQQRTPPSGLQLVQPMSNFSLADDSDVIAEKNRIHDLSDQGLLSQEAMAVVDLTKKFGNFTAVNQLTFGVHKEECFGLLGVNGAGKTTTFRMLTGDLFVDDGYATIDNYGLINDLTSFQRQVGYCPQFDALLDRLTGRETLFLFARLRGMRNNTMALNIQNMIEMVDLQKHADKCTETYSGGNKRKLSLAMALIGSPSIVFLDEPTTGVDPTARRKIWSTLVAIQEKYHCAIVLTSHSMEECEALCNRIGIMVNGKFRCLGSTQHLRSKYGQGFTLIVKIRKELSEDQNYFISVQNHIQKALPSASLKDIHEGILHYHITDTTIPWSHIFRVMESTKYEMNLEDYIVSDTTLEQIFLAFARSQQGAFM